MSIKMFFDKALTYAGMVGIYLSPWIAKRVSYAYWTKADSTHAEMSWESFNYCYSYLKDLMEPTKADLILDGACGSGEITHLFHKDGFNIEGFDISEKLIEKAKNSFPDIIFSVADLLNIKSPKKYTKILINNSFFYIHPLYQYKALKNLWKLLTDGGALYLTDLPDYDKRGRLNLSRIKMLFTKFFPVYQCRNSGFFIKKII